MAGLGSGLLARLRGKSRECDASPLASLKSATRWVANLPMGDVLKSQEIFATELKRFNDKNEAFTAERLGVLMLLDEKSREVQESLIRQYLRNPRMPREVESRLWHTVYALMWEIVRGYRAFVMNFSRSSGRCGYEKDVPLIALRAILHFSAVMKWRAFRYMQPSERLWQRLHSLYLVAETENLHRKPLLPYPDQKLKTTIETTYANTLMRDLVNTGTFYPRQIDLIDHWLANWNLPLTLGTHQEAENHGFFVDLNSDHGPKRTRNPGTTGAFRYWNAEPLIAKLRNVQDAIGEGLAPATLGLTDDARTTECQGLIDHLLRQWATVSGREHRRAPRVESKRMVELCHGFKAVLDQIKGMTPDYDPYLGETYAEAQDLQIFGFVTHRTQDIEVGNANRARSHHVESWIMQNESAHGYGATVESTGRDWLRVGELVALRPREEKIWQIGIIRRLSRIDTDSSAVGIETLADSACAVALGDASVQNNSYTVDGDDYSSATATQYDAIWLAGLSDGVASLLIDPVNYKQGLLLRVVGLTEASRIRLTTAIQHGDGWIQVHYEVA